MDSKSLKNIMKKKSNDEPPTNRLQSLRLPRDLSLGGTKPKKVFTPNVNVIRNKDKTKEIIKNLDRKRKDRNTKEFKNKNSDLGQRFVQSTGIFSEGTAGQKKSVSNNDRASYSRSESEHASISIPTYKKIKFTVDKEKEDKILDEIVSQNNDDDYDEEKMELNPVMWKNVESNALNRIKSENSNSNSHEVGYGRIPPYFQKMDECDEDSRLALIKLPDSLAGKGLSDDPNVKEIFDYPLNVMLEGKIGTLQIKRSGKMFMKIGNVKYLLEPTDFFSSRETVASFSESDRKDKPDIALLGDIGQRFVVNPIWKYLLKS